MIGIMPATCLDIHASYLCRHAGACCTAGWPIPVEDRPLARIAARFGESHVLRPEVSGGREPAAIIRAAEDGECPFHDRRAMRCRVHGELGVDALPSACRHFPRVVLHDRRGTFLTLSHYCPTAAELLFTTGDVRIVSAPDALVPPGRLEGLDARDALPPSLAPAMLMDMEAFDAWERRALSALCRAGDAPREALDLIAGATARLLSWTPGSGATLRRSVEEAFDAPPRASGSRDGVDLGRLVRLSVPRELAPPASPVRAAPRAHVERILNGHQEAVRRYLAARLFASWVPYFASSLMTTVAAVRAALAVLESEVARLMTGDHDGRTLLRAAIRHTDLLMVHLSDTRTLVRLLEQRV